jgi:8-oxo-dGTP pyrophosphatase MutT (NUDIX family)
MPESVGQRPAVVAVVARAGRVLVIKRGPQVARAGYWAPLSGRVEPGESQPEAVVREVREEVGLAVRPIAKVWECDTDDGRFRLYWWTAEVTGGELMLDPYEVSEARWLWPAEFRQLAPTFADDHVFFDTILPGLRLPA